MSEHAADIVNSLDAFIYSKDRAGNYTYANPQVQALFGADLAGIVGKDDSVFFDLERANDLRVNDEEVMATGTSISREERDVVKETGEERRFWTVKSPIFNSAGEVVGMSGISIALTS